MENQFSPQEILRISIEVEEIGAKLYDKLSKKTDNPEAKKIWDYLKEQEVEHKKIFSQILAKAGDYIVYELKPGEYDNYIRAISSEYIFSPQLIEEKLRQDFKDDLEAVNFGISIEKESILVYTSFKEYMKAERKELIDQVIEQEKKHYTDLVNLKKTLKK
ncbi:MAG: ferritin family protein [Candidatus Omnitrophica bacterium]|nr:ferritin family protein [Candidatus Omnitrophota bacterium]MCF7894391.1 ferritin family protein [Candidatus Omnitrophota bacterium]